MVNHEYDEIWLNNMKNLRFPKFIQPTNYEEIIKEIIKQNEEFEANVLHSQIQNEESFRRFG